MSVPAAYIAVVLIWSTTPLAIQWSGQGGHFLFAVASRMVIGLILTIGVMKLWRVTLPHDRDAVVSYFIAGMALFLAMVLVYWGASYIPSGLISVLFGLTPFVTGIMGTLFLNERNLSPLKLTGIIAGLVGLTMIYYAREGGGEYAIPGLIAVLCSVLVYSTSMIMIKRFGTHLNPIALNTGSLIVAVPLFLSMWLIFGHGIPESTTQLQWVAILYLGVFGTAIGFILYYYLLSRVTTGLVSIITLITPMVALWIGNHFNHERVANSALVGSVIILTGLVFYLLDDGLSRKKVVNNV